MHMARRIQILFPNRFVACLYALVGDDPNESRARDILVSPPGMPRNRVYGTSCRVAKPNRGSWVRLCIEHDWDNLDGESESEDKHKSSLRKVGSLSREFI
jgi:hypothetical protein